MDLDDQWFSYSYLKSNPTRRWIKDILTPKFLVPSGLGLLMWGVITFLLFLTGCSVVLHPVAFPTMMDDQILLGEAIQAVSFYVPKQHVYVLVDPMKWDAITKITKRNEWATRRAVCFAIYDHLAHKWEWNPHETHFTVYALPNNSKVVLLEGMVLDCAVSETASIWPGLEAPVHVPVPEQHKGKYL